VRKGLTTAVNWALFVLWCLWFALTLPWQLRSAQVQVMNAIRLDCDDTVENL
jgi:hypothetical protein